MKTLTVFLGLGYGLGNAQLSQALPMEGQVVSGSASINADKTTLQVNQTSDRTLINWNSFDIHAGEKVIFKQPSVDSLVVNRVLGRDLSSIAGSLSANGQIVLVNPNGMIFQNGSLVNVGGLIATTRWLNTEDFGAGRLTFNAQDQTTHDMVINRGVITIAPGGSAVLAASHVENSGLIQAHLGRITLAAGDSFTLHLDGDSLLTFAAPTTSNIGKTLNVINKGTIQADGGSILLTTSAAEEVVNSVVNIGGRVEAKAVDFQDGQIILHAGGGTATVSGTLDASGASKNQHGGTIQVSGNQIKLTETATLDASGHSAGGTVLIGKDRHQDNPKIQNAKQTIIDKGATIAANANKEGDGGKVIVWSDANTAFHGQISTRGGENSGNGGFNEVSSKGTLQFDGAVNATAPKGRPGTLLLDPSDITIVTTGANATTSNSDQFADPDIGGAGASKIAPASLNAANANIILQATNNITFTDAVSLNAGFSLTAQAGNDVTVNNSITTSNAALHLEADSPHTGAAGAADGTGTLTIAAPGSLTTSGGKITLIGADFSILGTLNAGSGNVDLGPSRTGTNGNITIGSGILTQAELQKITSTGTVTIGKATTKGTDGQGTGATTPQSDTITLDTTPLDFSGQTFALKLDPTSSILSGNLTITTNGGITFGAATTMSGTLSMLSNGGDITFSSAVDGSHSLTLTAGTGNVTFANNAGYITPVGDLTIKSAKNVTAAGIKSAYLTQEAGTGTTTFSGAIESTKAINITANGGITFDAATTMNEDSTWTTTGGDIRFNSTVNNSKNLTLSAGTGNIIFVGDAGGTNRLGNVTINSAQNISTAGIQAALMQFTSTGTATLNGAVNSTDVVNITANSGITFGSTLIMNGNSTFTTSGGNIRFNSTVDNNKTLTLTAGTGDVTFSGNVGSTTRLGDLTIQSAKNVTAAGIKATSLTQNSGSGSTTLNGIVDSSSTVSITANGGITFGSALTLNGPVTLITAGNDITFSDTLNSALNSTQNLTMTAGLGNITFAKSVGSTTPLGTITINTAKDVTANSTMNMNALTQSAGSGTSTFLNTITANGAGGLNLTGTNFSFNGDVDTLTAAVGGTLTVTNSGLLTIGANSKINLDGAFTQKGSGTSAIGGAITTTNDNISFGTAVTLGANTTLTGGTVNFDSTLDASTKGKETLIITGASTFKGLVGNTKELGALSISDVSTFNSTATSVKTDSTGGGSGNQTYSKAVTLNDGNASTTFTMTSNAGAITFTDKIDGQNAGKALLNVNTSGITTFGGAIGGSKHLASLVTDTGGTTKINGGSITTTDTQTYNDAVTLGANTTLTNPTVTFLNTVDASIKGAETLTITGAATFSGLVGNAKELGALSISDVSTFNSTATSVKTDSAGGGSGNQTYTKAVTLNDGNASTTFTMTSNAGAITFNDKIDGQNAGKVLLNVNTSGTSTFGGAIGGSKSLGSLVTDTGGTTKINGGAITTTDTQTYNDAITLGANTTLTSPTVTFLNTVDATTKGTETLTITGAATFSGLVGNTKELGALSISDVSTFNSTATSVKTDSAGGGSGNQTYTKAVTLNDGNASTPFTMTSNAGAITFNDKIDGQNAGKVLLNVNTSGTSTFGGAVGGSVNLASLVTDTGGATKISGGTITTTGVQTYGDAVSLGADTRLTGNTLQFNSTLESASGTTRSLIITGNGAFGDGTGTDTVGATDKLQSLTVSGTTIVAHSVPSIKTTDLQTYRDAITLNDGNSASASFSFISDTGDITFSKTINGQNAGLAALNVNTSGTTTFGGKIGTSVSLANLTTNTGGVTKINDSLITTTGTQTFNDAVTLATSATLTGSTVTFGNTLNATTKGAETLTITGAATFSGLVGNTKELGALSISDVSTFNSTATSVKTDNAGGGSGNQTYTKAVMLNDGNTSTTFHFTSNTGDIRFSKAIENQNAGKAALKVNTGGRNVFLESVGQSRPIHSITVDMQGNPQGTLTLAGDLNTNNNTDLSNTLNVSLTSPITIDTHAAGATDDAGNVMFASKGNMNGAYELTIDTRTDAGGQMGEIRLPAIGNKTPLKKLEVEGGTVTVNGNIFTDTGSVSFHQNSAKGELQKVILGDQFSCVTANCQEQGTQPALRIATNGGDIFFHKIVATSGPDQNYLHIELLAGQPDTPLQANIPLLPKERLDEVFLKFKQVKGGEIKGDLDVWNATLTGSRGALSGQIHKTYNHFGRFDIQGWAAAQTLYASPILDQSYTFTLNGHPVFGSGTPQESDPAYKNLGRGSTDYIPNRTEQKDFMLDSSKNPKLYDLMEDWEKNENKPNEEVHSIIKDPITKNKYVEMFYSAMKKNVTHHAIIIGVSKNKKFFNESLGDGPKTTSKIMKDLFLKVKYNVVDLITDNKPSDQPEWKNVIMSINGFAKAAQKIETQQDLIIYFIGHGIKHNHRGFWLLQDAGIESMQNIVSLQQIKTALYGPSDTNQPNIQPQAILILESCYPSDMSPMPLDPSNKKKQVHSGNSSTPGTLISLTPSFPFSSLLAGTIPTNNGIDNTTNKKENANSPSQSTLDAAPNPNTDTDTDTDTYFSHFLAKTLTQQFEDTGKIDTSKIHKLIKERFTGWIELNTARYYTNFLNDFNEYEPQYGFIEKQHNQPTNDPFVFEEKQQPNKQPDK